MDHVKDVVSFCSLLKSGPWCTPRQASRCLRARAKDALVIQAECYDYLFECAIKLRSLGIDVAKPSPVVPQPVAAPEQANGHAGDAPICREAASLIAFPSIMVLLGIGLLTSPRSAAIALGRSIRVCQIDISTDWSCHALTLHSCCAANGELAAKWQRTAKLPAAML